MIVSAITFLGRATDALRTSPRHRPMTPQSRVLSTLLLVCVVLTFGGLALSMVCFLAWVSWNLPTLQLSRFAAAAGSVGIGLLALTAIGAVVEEVLVGSRRPGESAHDSDGDGKPRSRTPRGKDDP